MGKREKNKPRIIDRIFFLDVFLDPRYRLFFIYLLIVILIGTAIFHWLEGWDWLDSFYFVVITLTTIGYGDFSPTTPLTKIITIFYGINGIIVLLMFYDIIRRSRRLELPDEDLGTDDG
jgi:hypothetical protein